MNKENNRDSKKKPLKFLRICPKIKASSKPDPEVFLKAAEMLGLSPQECLVVEDAEAGIDAAEAGGFHHAGIGSAAGYAKTQHRLSRFADLLAL